MDDRLKKTEYISSELPVVQHSFNLKYLYSKFIDAILDPPPNCHFPFYIRLSLKIAFYIGSDSLFISLYFFCESMQKKFKCLGWYVLYTQGSILACVVSLRTWVIMSLPNFLIAFVRLKIIPPPFSHPFSRARQESSPLNARQLYLLCVRWVINSLRPASSMFHDRSSESIFYLLIPFSLRLHYCLWYLSMQYSASFCKIKFPLHIVFYHLYI